MIDPRLLDDESRKAGLSLEPQRPKALVNPGTGELLDLAAPSAELAHQLYEIRDLESKLREFKGEVTEEVYRRLDANARWSDRFGDFQVTGRSPEPDTEYDGERLFDALKALHDQGLISLEAAEAALEVVKTYKPKKRGLNALLKLGGKVAEEIHACEVEPEPRRRYLKIDRAF